jgi:hypothetical protein
MIGMDTMTRTPDSNRLAAMMHDLIEVSDTDFRVAGEIVVDAGGVDRLREIITTLRCVYAAALEKVEKQN